MFEKVLKELKEKMEDTRQFSKENPALKKEAEHQMIGLEYAIEIIEKYQNEKD